MVVAHFPPPIQAATVRRTGPFRRSHRWPRYSAESVPVLVRGSLGNPFPGSLVPEFGPRTPRVGVQRRHQRLQNRVNRVRRAVAVNAPVTPTKARAPATVVQPKQQRADRLWLASMGAVPSNDAVSGTLVLDLAHHPLASVVAQFQGFCDHPVQASTSNDSNHNLAVARSRGRWSEVNRDWAGSSARSSSSRRRAMGSAVKGRRRRSRAGRSRQSSPGSGARAAVPGSRRDGCAG